MEDTNDFWQRRAALAYRHSAANHPAAGAILEVMGEPVGESAPTATHLRMRHALFPILVLVTRRRPHLQHVHSDHSPAIVIT